MNKQFSTSLDALRLVAALVVFLGHLSHPRFTGDILSIFRGIEHDAVIVFFVLSGYVISYVVKNKDSTFQKYLTSRFSRLYSVVIPAICLTIIADSIGLAFNPSLYDGIYADSYSLIRVTSNILFVQEFWGASVRFFSNGPFWSLSYEFSYYILFAFYFYFSGYKRVICLLLGCLIVGPYILLLAPVWLLGVLIENVRDSRFYRVNIYCAVIVVPGLFLIYKMNFQEYIPVYKELLYSSKFLGDYITGVFIASEIYFIRSIMNHRSVENKKETGIKLSIYSSIVSTISSYTFSLYLYHFPLLLMVYAVFDPAKGSVVELISIVLLVFLVIVLLGHFTERKKHIFNKAIEYIVSYVFLLYSFLKNLTRLTLAKRVRG